jgi:hypothetical protein
MTSLADLVLQLEETQRWCHYGAIFIHIFGQNIFKGAMELNIMSCYCMLLHVCMN